MANGIHTPGVQVAWNRFAVVLWYDNEPWLEIYRVQPQLEEDPTEESGVRFTGKFVRDSKVSCPVDEECYAQYGARFLNALPMLDMADHRGFFAQAFELENPPDPSQPW